MIKIFSPEAFRDYMENPELVDYDYNGVIVLQPTSCELSVEINSTWELTLVHPYDEEGRYTYIQKGCVLKLPCKVAREQEDEEQLFRIYEVRDKLDEIEVKAYPIVEESINETPISYAQWYDIDAPTLVDTLNGMITDKYSIDSEVPATNQASIIAENTNVQEVLLGDQDLSFINCFGGEVVYDNYTYRIRDKVGSDTTDSGLEPENKVFYGASLEDISITESDKDVITRIFPVSGDGYEMGSDGYPKYLDDFVWYVESGTGYTMYGDGRGNFISNGYAMGPSNTYRYLDTNGHWDSTRDPATSDWQWTEDDTGRRYGASSYEKHYISLAWVEDATDKHYWIDSRGWYDHTYNDYEQWTWRESSSQEGKWWYGSSAENYAYNGWMYVHANAGWYLFDAQGYWVEGATPPSYLNDYAWHVLPDGHQWYVMEQTTYYYPASQWMKVDDQWYWFDDDGYSYQYEERPNYVDSEYIETYPIVYARSIKYDDVELIDTNYADAEQSEWNATQIITDSVKQDLVNEVRTLSEKYLKMAHTGDWPYPFSASRSGEFHNRHDPWADYDELKNRICLPYGYLFYSYTDAVETLKEKAIPKEYYNSSNTDLYSFFCDCINDGFKWCETTDIATWDWREKTTQINDDGMYQYLYNFAWRNDGYGDYYGDGAGHYMVNAWVEDASNKHYWCNPQGYWDPTYDDMSEWSWHQESAGWTYGSEDGVNHAVNQWIHIANESKWYYFNADGYYVPFDTQFWYGTEDGSDYVFYMWHKVGNYLYWFDKDGYVDTNLRYAHNFEWHEDDNGHYYGDGNGHYIKNGWVEDSSSAHYWCGADGYYKGTAKDSSTDTEDPFDDQDEELGTGSDYCQLTINMTMGGDPSSLSSKSIGYTVSGPNGYSYTLYTTGSGSASLTDLTPGEYTITEDGTDDEGSAQISGYYLTVGGDNGRTFDIKADHRHWWNITNTYTIDEPAEEDDTDNYTDTEEWTWHGSKEEGYWYGTEDDDGKAKNYPTSQFMWISDYNAWVWFDEHGYYTAAYMSSGSWDWTKDGAGWWYTDGNENWPCGQWMKIDSKWYFFGSYGYADSTTDDFDAKTSQTNTEAATLDTNREGISTTTSTSSTVSDDYDSNREGVRAWIQDGFVNAIKNKIVQAYNTLKEHLDEELLTYATYDLTQSDSYNVTVEIDVKELAKSQEYEKFKWLEETYLGDKIHIESSKHSFSVDERITELTYDCIAQKVTDVVLGYPTQYAHIRNAKLTAKKGTFRPYVSLIYLENGWDTVDDKYLSASNKPGKDLEAKR